jgi:hypothetical protein
VLRNAAVNSNAAVIIYWEDKVVVQSSWTDRAFITKRATLTEDGKYVVKIKSEKNYDSLILDVYALV